MEVRSHPDQGYPPPRNKHGQQVLNSQEKANDASANSEIRSGPIKEAYHAELVLLPNELAIKWAVLSLSGMTSSKVTKPLEWID